jgi:hypothetical protein
VSLDIPLYRTCPVTSVNQARSQTVRMTFRKTSEGVHSRIYDERYFEQLSLTIFKWVTVM